MDESARIAYLAIERTAKSNGYVGGLLVIDPLGLPLEFLCTHAVRPSDTQKNLYGKALEPYISVNLCGERLISKLSSAISCIIVRDSALLEVRGHCKYPVISIHPPNMPNSFDPDIIRNKMELGNCEYQVVETASNKKFPDDWNTTQPILQNCSKQIDILEPFDRIKIALQSLGDRDENFR